MGTVCDALEDFDTTSVADISPEVVEPLDGIILITDRTTEPAPNPTPETPDPEKFTTVKDIQGYTKVAERRPNRGTWTWLTNADEKAVILYLVYEASPKTLGLVHRRLGVGSYDLLAFRLPS